MVSGSRILTGVERDKREDLADNQVPDAACSDCDGRATAKRLRNPAQGCRTSITQRSRAEARQPWAMLHNRFAVEPQGQA